jgi:L-threonylcarbamoyladenylate synthase
MHQIYTWDSSEGLNAAQAAFNAGLAIVGDSDTVLGLFAPCSRAGIDLLDLIKGRREKPYLILVGSVEQVWELAEQPSDPDCMRLLACWPGPLTLIFTARPDVPDYMQSVNHTIAVRIPDHEALQTLALRCGGLFSTSANKTGMPVPESVERVDAGILAMVSCVVRNGTQNKENVPKQPSTILDCTGDVVRVVRTGAYPIDALATIYGKSFGRPTP